MTISQPPRSTFYGGEIPNDGTAVNIEYEDAGILWDDGSDMLWDDGSEILWSHVIATSPDVGYSFSIPRTVYSGELEE